MVSPGSSRMDYYTKLFKYSSAKVREYWIVNSTQNLILVYNFEKEDFQQFTLSDSVKAGIYDELEIDFSQIDI